MKKILLMLIIPVFLLSGCCFDCWDCEDGEGPVVSQTLILNDFHSFELLGSETVILRQGEEQEVVVEAQQNIINLLETGVRNGRWDIEFEDCIRSYEDVVIYITLPEISSITLSGSGLIQTSDWLVANKIELNLLGSGEIDALIDAEDLKVDVTGSGKIVLEGAADIGDFRITGSGVVSAYELPLMDCNVNISGSGNVKTRCNDNLDIDISGSGDVYYRGNPNINSSVSGSGKVINDN